MSYLDGSTQAFFTFNTSPVTAQGLQTMHIDAGAFLRAPDNDPSIAFDGTFRYDITTLQVTATSPGFPNGLFTLPGPLTYDVTFNEALDPASIQTTDLVLSGIPGAFVSGFTLLPGDTTIRFTINGAATEGVLTATINAGSVTDVFSNPGLSFTANYEVDFGIVPLPTPLTSLNPAGSLIYDPVVSGRVNFASDVDSFTVNVDPGQTITILMTPTQATLQPTIELRDPSNSVIGSASAGAANQNALLQTVAATSGGVYTIRLSGAGGSIGNYTFEVTLNAALENESNLPGSGNDSLANAQSVNSSFITLQTALATAQRGAIRGTTDVLGYSVAAVPFAFEDISSTGTIVAGLTNQDDASVSTNIGFSFPLYGTNYTTVFVGANGLLSFVSANTAFTNTDLTTSPTQASFAVFWDDLHTNGGQLGSNVFTQVLGAGPNQRYVIQWNQVRFFSGGTAGDTITFQAQLYADGRIQMNYLDLTSGTAPGNNGASATSGAKNLGTQGPDRLLLAFNNGPNAFLGTGLSTLITPPTPLPDYYSFNMQAGQTFTAALTSMNSLAVNFDLRDSTNAVIASGASGPNNVTRILNNFVIPTTGTYYLSVSAPTSSVPYTLVTNRNADFDSESNNSFATAQNLGSSQGVLGAITADSVYSGTAIPFAFEDISSTGTIVAGLTNQDDASVSIPIGFNFKMYGTTYTSLFASSNGLITFGSANTAFTNDNLTLSPTQAAIAVFWDDQHTGGGLAGSNVFTQVTGTGNNQHLTIQWNQVRYFSGGTTGDTITYQVQLYADGR
ncbi:MAG TPA: hypothetical protein PLX97_04570, partial [Gemmatales bacterium]|nr:hypothetical protein [Gemmatales bacterium]